MNKSQIVMFLLIGLMTSSECFSAEGLGRLFLSPSERIKLDKQREEFYRPVVIEPEIEIPVVETPEPEAVEVDVAPNILVNGYVKRSGTSGTVWLNGQSTYDGDVGSLRVDHQKTQIIGRKVKLAPLNDAEPVFLKPGQHFSPNNNEIADSYELIDPVDNEDSVR